MDGGGRGGINGDGRKILKHNKRNKNMNMLLKNKLKASLGGDPCIRPDR